MQRAASVLAVAVLAMGATGATISGAAAEASAGGTGIRVERDLTYRTVGGEDVKLDAYVPDGAGLHPGLIVIYGGGWVEGNKAQSELFSRFFAAQGYVAFAIDYRLAPQHPSPAAVDDVRASVEWVRAHASDFGLDPGRIGAIGGSAGGHLASMLATLGDGPLDRGSRIAAAVSWAGPMDLDPAGFPPDSLPYVESFLGCVGRQCDEAKIDAASPISHVNEGDSPIWLGVGVEDLLVPPDQNERMAAALSRVGVRHELLVVDDAGHDWRLAPQVIGPSIEFLRRELGGVEQAPRGTAGSGGGGGLVGPAIAVGVAVVAIVVGAAALIALRRRRMVRY
jgi:acetyl esterase/lipase